MGEAEVGQIERIGHHPKLVPCQERLFFAVKRHRIQKEILVISSNGQPKVSVIFIVFIYFFSSQNKTCSYQVTRLFI